MNQSFSIDPLIENLSRYHCTLLEAKSAIHLLKVECKDEFSLKRIYIVENALRDFQFRVHFNKRKSFCELIKDWAENLGKDPNNDWESYYFIKISQEFGDMEDLPVLIKSSGQSLNKFQKLFLDNEAFLKEQNLFLKDSNGLTQQVNRVKGKIEEAKKIIMDCNEILENLERLEQLEDAIAKELKKSKRKVHFDIDEDLYCIKDLFAEFKSKSDIITDEPLSSLNDFPCLLFGFICLTPHKDFNKIVKKVKKWERISQGKCVIILMSYLPPEDLKDTINLPNLSYLSYQYQLDLEGKQQIKGDLKGKLRELITKFLVNNNKIL